MKGTIFQNILNECTLKFPSNKSLPFKAIPKIQNLAISFYMYFFDNILKVKNSSIFLKPYNDNGQNIRQSYESVFYVLENKNQRVLDFIACLVCLVGDTLFTPKIIQENPELEQFFQTLTREDQKLRQYLYIVYTFETIGYKVGKQSAEILFKRYIISENIDQSNFRQGIRVNLQLKDLKNNIENKTENVCIRPRTKKRTKSKFQNQFANEVKNIFVENNYEIQQEKRNIKKFQRLMNKCITEGDFSSIHQLPRGSPDAIAEISSILSHPSKKKNTDSKQKEKESQNNKNFLDWVKIIEKMKNTKFMSRQEVMNALGGDCHPNWPIIGDKRCALKKQNIGQRKQKRFNQSNIKKTINSKRTFGHKSVLPSLSEMGFGQEKQQNVLHSVDRGLHKDSKRLKQQLSQFIEERKKRFIRG